MKIDVVPRKNSKNILTLYNERLRKGWEKEFQQMAQRGDDYLLEESIHFDYSWDKEEWTW